MINVNELRIGNLLNTVIGKILGQRQMVKVDTNHIVHIAEGNLVNYEPIPLTPEILESCGFKTNEAGETFILCRTSFKKDSMGWLKYILTNGISFEGYNFEDETFFEHIKYLHQLQNLYFALTGKELEVKL